MEDCREKITIIDSVFMLEIMQSYLLVIVIGGLENSSEIQNIQVFWEAIAKYKRK